MNECIFCKIINKEANSYTIYEDEYVKVFLNINPSTNGDCLLIPKKHFQTINDIDNEWMCRLLNGIKETKKILEEKLLCDGLTISQNNGYGQEIEHFHIHLTPRYLNDECNHTFNKRALVNIEDVYIQITN